MLSEALSDNSGTPGPPPLGRLLVERGFLTEEQLQIGLAEHGRTGLPLGQVLIGMGFVTTAIIAQALATQAGGMVKTEYGYSTGFATEQAAPLPVETAPQPPAEVIPLRQEAPQPEAPQAEAPAQQAWSAPPEVPLPPVEAPAPAPVAEVPAPPEMTLPPIPAPVPVPVLDLHPEPAAVETHDAAEAELAMAAARIEELQAELREQLRRTEASEARLAELAADAEAARDGLSSAVQRFDSMKQEIAAARQVELELRDENERLATAAAELTPARELQVVRMEIASMRNELTTVMEALRAVHARLGEHSTSTPAPVPAHTPMVGVPEPNADAYRLVPN